MRKPKSDITTHDNGVGEKCIVYKHVGDYDANKIRSFFEAMPEHMQNEILALGISNYFLGSGDEEFIRQMHDFFFPNCKMEYFVRYQ